MFYKLNNYALNKLSFNLFLLGIQKKSKSNDKFDLDFLFFGNSKGDCSAFIDKYLMLVS